MRESAIEKSDRARHKAAGNLMLKFVSPGLVGVPDNILLKPIPSEHREIVGRYFSFVEYKKPNQKPRPSQQRRASELTQLGYAVKVIDQPNTLL